MKITDPKRMRALVSAETTGSFHRDGWGQQHLAVAPPTAVYRLPGRIEIIHGRSETMAGDWARINIPEFSKKLGGKKMKATRLPVGVIIQQANGRPRPLATGNNNTQPPASLSLTSRTTGPAFYVGDLIRFKMSRHLYDSLFGLRVCVCFVVPFKDFFFASLIRLKSLRLCNAKRLVEEPKKKKGLI